MTFIIVCFNALMTRPVEEYTVPEKIRYLLWALVHIVDRDFSCPACGNIQTHLIRRKALVTSLRECDACGLRFRAPKDSPEASIRFYQTRYRQGFTTDCPSDEALEHLLTTHFRGSPKDCSSYIEALRAVGLRPGDPVLDFGCSWGYGSWQLREAGFRVYSYEVSRPRAKYAALKLHCQLVDNFNEIPERVKCFFSAHVIEHLPNPDIMWKAIDQVLSKDGIVVCFAPNGEPSLERVYGPKRYHRLWGRVHPLLLTSQALKEMARRYGFVPYIFSSPYSSDQIRLLQDENNPRGEELLLVAQRG